MTDKTHLPQQLPSISEASYFGGLAVWLDGEAKICERRGCLPVFQRSDVNQMFSDWLLYGGATAGEHQRRRGLSFAMLNALHAKNLNDVADHELWLCVTFLVAQYVPAWLPVWEAHTRASA